MLFFIYIFRLLLSKVKIYEKKQKNDKGGSIVREIKQCQKCLLCRNQEPLIDVWQPSDVCFVGLSAKIKQKEEETPLDKHTNTGKIIYQIEQQLIPYTLYKTNLVKCVPLDEHQKLRYPNTNEIDCCITHLELEFEAIQPKVVFLLGRKVQTAMAKNYDLKFEQHKTLHILVAKHKETFFVNVYHPSYIYVYKRDKISEYVEQINTISRTQNTGEVAAAFMRAEESPFLFFC